MLSQFIKDIENLIERAQDNGIKNKDLEKSIREIVEKKLVKPKKTKRKTKTKLCYPVMFISDSSDDEY
jgi:hypothetical protein